MCAKTNPTSLGKNIRNGTGSRDNSGLSKLRTGGSSSGNTSKTTNK